MAQRHFTPEEANAQLERVRPAAEALVEHRRAMASAARERARFVQRIAGNGGDFDPQEPGRSRSSSSARPGRRPLRPRSWRSSASR
jgi:hypothetical protein